MWLLPETNGIVKQMPDVWGENVALVFDNSSVRKSVAKRLSDRSVFKFLPSYSPELNSVERFFEELHRCKQDFQHFV